MVVASGVELDNVDVNYVAPGDVDAFAVYAYAAEGFKLVNSEIKFVGNVANEHYQYGVKVEESSNVVIKNNKIETDLPARNVQSAYYNPEIYGIYQDLSLAVGIQNGDNVVFSENVVENTVIGETVWTTLDTIMVDGTTNLQLTYNNITQTDSVSTGVAYYNEIDLYSFTGIVQYNNIEINTNTGADGSGTAYAIQMNGPFTADVSYNNISASSNGPTAGIMTANWNGGIANLTVTFNTIDVTGSGNPGSYGSMTTGIEVQSNVAKVYNNTIYAKASDEYENVYGISNAQYSSVDEFDIKDNIVYTEGKYAVVINYADDSTVSNNYLIASELFGDDSVYGGDVVENNYPDKLNLTVTADEIKVGEDAVITITADSAFDGNVSVIVNGEEQTVALNKGTGSLTVSGLAANNYTVVASYEGNYYFHADEANATLVVSKHDSEMTIEINNTEPIFGDDVEITVTVPGATGEVTIIVDGNETTVGLTDGVAKVTIENITSGDHYVIAVYKGDSTVAGNMAEYKFNVSKIDDYEFELNITSPDVKVGDTLDINVTLPEDATGKLVVYVDGKEVPYFETENGISVPGIESGDHEITVSYSDDKYGDKSIEFNVTVDKLDSGLSAAANNITVGENATIAVTIANDVTGNVKVVLLGTDYPVTITNGKGSVTIANLTEGTYTAKAIFDGDDNYLPAEIEVSFTVSRVETDVSSAINVTVPENTTTPVFSVNLPDDATGYLLVDVDGNKSFAEVKNGKAELPIPNLEAGNYTAVVKYTGDDKYAPFETTTDISIPANVDENALTIPETSTSPNPTFSVDLPKDATGYLIVDVDGTKYAAEVVNGSASVTVPGLSNGNHNVVVTYTGDGKYSSISKNTTVNVNVPKPVVKLSAKNVKVVYSAKASFKVLVTIDGKKVAGKSVKIKFNGKTYTAKTNKKGYATLKLKTKVKPKKYTIKATYNGVSVSKKVTVKHLIKASNKKAKKSKKFKLKVKTNKVNKKYLKGKKLKLKFKGKTYKAKINKKGVAKFTIKKKVMKKLKKGKKYKYTVSYGKDKVTKKIKIKK